MRAGPLRRGFGALAGRGGRGQYVCFIRGRLRGFGAHLLALPPLVLLLRCLRSL